ncbi:YdaS family helix-turn-helix protein [Limnohabitans sp.]|uniref:transcriptional regulator n=1 Tax=Limnohabitans sp. TaxID=1907725 RepID=UPI00286F7450|nr:YdaS family helix-turn-helix protein [Limnohabitans sp.]
MEIKDYLDKTSTAGHQLAALIGIAPSYLSQMIAGHRPWKPAHCTAIERITGGKVTRQGLRPNDYWLIWPDLQQPAEAKDVANA